MIILDASVLIAHLDPSDVHHDAATELLVGAARTEFAASLVTFAEVLVGPARAGQIDAARATLDDLGVVELPLPDDASNRLAKLRADTGLRLPDCCVLLAAAGTGGRVLSFNERLLREAARLSVRSD